MQNAKFQLDIQILQISSLVTFWFLVLMLYILGLNNCLHRGGIKKCLPPPDSCTGVKTSPLSAILTSLPNHLGYKADGLSHKFSMDSPIPQVLLIKQRNNRLSPHRCLYSCKVKSWFVILCMQRQKAMCATFESYLYHVRKNQLSLHQ